MSENPVVSGADRPQDRGRKVDTCWNASVNPDHSWPHLKSEHRNIDFYWASLPSTNVVIVNPICAIAVLLCASSEKGLHR